MGLRTSQESHPYTERLRGLVAVSMSEHDWVVRRIARYHFERGDEVYSSQCRGFRKALMFRDPRGEMCAPDIWLKGQRVVYEIEPTHDLTNQDILRIGVIAADPEVRMLMVVLCHGAEQEATRLEDMLRKRKECGAGRAKIHVFIWQNLFAMHRIPTS